MKTLIIKHDIHGTRTKVNAKKTYATDLGQWVAEVDASEMNRACMDLCRGIKNCSCGGLHGEAAQDDDGKKYRIMTS